MSEVRQSAHGADAVGSNGLAARAGQRPGLRRLLRIRHGVLRLVNPPLRVRIVGARTAACGGGVGDAWRATAAWVAAQLARRFGDTVRVEYFDVFDPACPPLPEGAQLPLVTVGEDVLTSGGKISLPAIRRRLEALAAEQPVTRAGV